MMIRQDNGFTLIELLLVVAIIAIIAAIAVPGLMRARMAGNEASAIGSMRTISSAQAAFAASCGGGGFANTLADLGRPPLAGNSTFIPVDLAAADPSGSPKSGYEFTITGGHLQRPNGRHDDPVLRAGGSCRTDYRGTPLRPG
jgi:prepilin-type N-terminal cleavage/methylation domain-containing protein